LPSARLRYTPMLVDRGSVVGVKSEGCGSQDGQQQMALRLYGIGLGDTEQRLETLVRDGCTSKLLRSLALHSLNRDLIQSARSTDFSEYTIPRATLLPH
jgi:hypothetical protein